MERFPADLKAHGGSPRRITDVCCDLSDAFIAGVGAPLPKAQITFDGHHLVQLVTRAVDEVRRVEVKRRPELKGTPLPVAQAAGEAGRAS